MKSDGPNSLLSSAWHAALVLCGIAVLVWIAAKLIASVWVVIVIIAAVVVMGAAALIILQWWLRSRRW
jgi:hypothetical protein